MKEMCRTMGTVVLVLGIIASIALAWKNGVTITDIYYSGVVEERNFFLTVIWFLCGIVTTAITATILHALGEILEIASKEVIPIIKNTVCSNFFSFSSTSSSIQAVIGAYPQTATPPETYFL